MNENGTDAGENGVRLFAEADMEENKKKMRFLPVLIAVVLTAALTVAACAFYVHTRYGAAIAFGKEYPKLLELSEIIDEWFVGEKDPAAVADSSAAGMVDGLGDRWSYYLSAEELKEYDVTMANNYVGIGVMVTKEENGPLEIQSVQEGGSAAEAGMLPGDRITAVNGTPVDDLTLEEATGLVTGEEGTPVNLLVLRGEESFELTLLRVAIHTEPVQSEMLGDVGYIRLDNFYSESADAFIQAAQQLLDQGAEALVVDVRFNGGGYVSEVTQMLDYLLPEGVIFHMEYTDGRVYDVTSDPSRVDVPVGVLVNDRSFSAAEYFAETIRVYDSGIVGGQATTGKGYSQTMMRLSDGSGVNLSTARYFTPDGRSLADVGIVPDVSVEVDEEEYFLTYYKTLPREEDHQLQALIEALTTS